MYYMGCAYYSLPQISQKGIINSSFYPSNFIVLPKMGITATLHSYISAGR